MKKSFKSFLKISHFLVLQHIRVKREELLFWYDTEIFLIIHCGEV